MPRRRPLERAVSSSPLFLLSPELRSMIFRFLLTTSEQVVFYENPIRPYSILHRVKSKDPAPDLFPSILLTCRLIYREACPLLYRGNTFYFCEPSTSDSFRWGTASKYATWVEEIAINLHTCFLPSAYDGREEKWLDFMEKKPQFSHGNFARWLTYLSKGRFNLKYNYPHLKRLTITLGLRLNTARTKDLRSVCKLIGQHIRGLDSVHIIGLNDTRMVDAFMPMVESVKTSPGDPRSVQMDITELQTKVGWKNVMFWWGRENEKPPHHTFKSETDLRRRQSLFKMGDEPNIWYTFGESFLPRPPDA